MRAPGVRQQQMPPAPPQPLRGALRRRAPEWPWKLSGSRHWQQAWLAPRLRRRPQQPEPVCLLRKTAATSFRAAYWTLCNRAYRAVSTAKKQHSGGISTKHSHEANIHMRLPRLRLPTVVRGTASSLLSESSSFGRWGHTVIWRCVLCRWCRDRGSSDRIRRSHRCRGG